MSRTTKNVPPYTPNRKQRRAQKSVLGAVQKSKLAELAAQTARVANSTREKVGYTDEERAEFDAILQENGELPDPPREWGDLND